MGKCSMRRWSEKDTGRQHSLECLYKALDDPPRQEAKLAPGAQPGRGVRPSPGCEILNRMTALGRPVSYRIGR